MVPTDYRLDHVSARLVERLEGARPTHTDADAALAEFRRIAERHVEAAIGEYREVGLTEDPEAHAAFLRAEVLKTFLPRYHRMAMEMTAREGGGFGFGKVATPLGRLSLGAVVVTLLALTAKFLVVPFWWPFILLLLSLPFWPDIAAAAHRRRYRNDLEAVIGDMTKIQDQARAYLPADQLRVDDPQQERHKAAASRPTEREGS